MKKEAIVEVFSEEVNFAVIRVFSRKYPRVLIQGDSLLALLGAAKEAIEFFEEDKDEAMAALNYLYEELDWRFKAYQKVLEESNTHANKNRVSPDSGVLREITVAKSVIVRIHRRLFRGII